MQKCFVIGVKEHDGQYYATADEIKVEADIVSFLKNRGYTHCYLMETKVQARNIAAWWNKRWGAEGKYNMFL